jgi:hypothetical protein
MFYFIIDIISMAAEMLKRHLTKRLQLACIFEGGKYNGNVSKGQTHREVGTQSHGSCSLMRIDWETARPPKIFGGFFIYSLKRWL